jgi:hypothetical protein
MKTTTYLNGGVVIESDRPEPTPLEKTRTALFLAVTAYAYTHKLETQGNMSDCVDRCIDLVSEGSTLRAAVAASFVGKLRDVLLSRIDRAAGRRMITRGHYSNHQEGAL